MKKKINYGFRRTDVLFFGVVFGMFLPISVLLFGFNCFNFFNIDSTWVTLSWIILLFIVIFPVRFFPNTKYAKWWDKIVF
jgi:hypothetical protein